MAQPDLATASVPATEEISLYDIVGFLGDYWKLMTALAVVAAVAMAIYVFTLPAIYESTATLVVAAPKPRPESTRPVLAGQAYQRLLESDLVQAKALEQLIQAQVLPPDYRGTLPVTAKVIAPSRPDESTIIEATASALMPDKAQKIADLWVKAFLKHVSNMLSTTGTLATTVLQKQLTDARTALSKLETERTAADEAQFKKQTEKILALEEAVAKAKNDGADKMTVYSDETRKLTIDLLKKGNLEAREAEANSMKLIYSELQEEYARLGSQIELQRLRLEAARKQLAQTPPMLMQRKAIGDDALWQSVADKGAKASEQDALKKLTLISELPNPLHAELARKAANAELELNTLTPHAERLKTDLARMEQELKAVSTSAREIKSARQQLEDERESGLAKIKELAKSEASARTRMREQAQKEFEHEKSADIARLDREIAGQQDLCDRMTKSWNALSIAKSQEDLEDLRIAAEPVIPSAPTQRRQWTYVLAAAFGGGMLGMFIALLRRFSTGAPSSVLKPA
ncbi:MAG TPA: Wzz/FepE/Etk N-terminal domain-containing protein [Planctomycetota bacterium]|jgi:capsular polysaccharide biosynthesis protein